MPTPNAALEQAIATYHRGHKWGVSARLQCFELACAKGDRAAAEVLKRGLKITSEEAQAAENSCLRYALYCHHFELADWLIEELGVTTDSLGIGECWELSEDSAAPGSSVERWLETARLRNQARTEAQ